MPESVSDHKRDAASSAQTAVEEAWRELQRTPFVQLRLGILPQSWPDISLAEAQRRSDVGRALLNRLNRLDEDILPHDLALTLRLVRFNAQAWSREADWYWLAIDPRGIGSFGLFCPTAYCGGYLLNFIHHQLSLFSFRDRNDLARYLDLISDYARLIDQFKQRTQGQAERGIRMPKVQVRQARALLTAFKEGARSALGVAPQRLCGVAAGRFIDDLESRIETQVIPAFDRALQDLSDAYFERAPDKVGIGQYSGGEELYVQLVKLHTTLDLTSEEVHARGLERIIEIEGAMRAIREELGFTRDNAALLAQWNGNPRWRARTVEEMTGFFQRYIVRCEPRLKECFSKVPEAAYRVAPLPEALQGSMTFGYYDPPRSDRREGRYLFNSTHLARQPLYQLAALTYHELMPGHHMHFASQQENGNLHPLRTNSFVNAYNEGWAEYAGGLAQEIGLYEEPEERYGRLLFDSFLTTRLVIDTGMNVFGWSLERARDYMLKHSGLTEEEVGTELIRYSCDRPGQALAYKLGDTWIFGLRDRMRRGLGSNFTLQRFHEAILAPGGVPLRDLEWHIDHEIARYRA